MVKSKTIKSPVTGLKDIQLLKKISTSQIKKLYLNNFHIDVGDYFKKIKFVYIYKCLTSNYSFYYPFSVMGKSDLYQKLQGFSWYYMDWKWEHDQSLGYFHKNENILEIGCGDGGFLHKLKGMKLQVMGMETSKSAISRLKQRGVSYCTKFTDQSMKKKQFDAICMFQVLEHIPNVRNFLVKSLKVLKKSGILIISTPNNNSFIKYNNQVALNMPPHHMGLWDAVSLQKISEIFNLELLKLHFEPLQSYHRRYYISTMTSHYSNKIPILRFPIFLLVNLLVFFFAPLIKGQTIMAVYIKK